MCINLRFIKPKREEQKTSLQKYIGLVGSLVVELTKSLEAKG